jgi:hypothetical protein
LSKFQNFENSFRKDFDEEAGSSRMATVTAHFYDDLSEESPVKKVQFEIGGAPVPSTDHPPTDKKKHSR